MKIKLIALMMIAGLTVANAEPLVGQQMELPKPGPELDVFQPDVGTWDVEIKAWGDDGKPVVTNGKETNRMLGGFWLLTDFQGSMLGFDFQGHGMYSYDAEKKQYVGSWVDSLSASKMDMIGTYNKEKNTMTYEGMAPGADGTPAKHILNTKYKEDGTRMMTMHLKAGDQKIKIFEMTYSKAK
jgi:hypothetical protein